MICRIVQNPACLEQLHSSVKQSALDLWRIPQVEIYIGHLQKWFINVRNIKFSIKVSRVNPTQLF
ncbi:hypothetical protein HanXRQr2_Chr10g0422781 [Helianthus annuus]|uniref:Uncharacterized protein n=1 Tax=Helianthus annuus TaxID=4232 RepID=A0A9K3HUY4_HELAN|nr:hypothetical protein HanXRQr2_Chr10g0422781 [Helianthus annuus]